MCVCVRACVWGLSPLSSQQKVAAVRANAATVLIICSACSIVCHQTVMVCEACFIQRWVLLLCIVAGVRIAHGDTRVSGATVSDLTGRSDDHSFVTQLGSKQTENVARQYTLGSMYRAVLPHVVDTFRLSSICLSKTPLIQFCSCSVRL